MLRPAKDPRSGAEVAPDAAEVVAPGGNFSLGTRVASQFHDGFS